MEIMLSLDEILAPAYRSQIVLKYKAQKLGFDVPYCIKISKIERYFSC